MKNSIEKIEIPDFSRSFPLMCPLAVAMAKVKGWEWSVVHSFVPAPSDAALALGWPLDLCRTIATAQGDALSIALITSGQEVFSHAAGAGRAWCLAHRFEVAEEDAPCHQ